MQKQILLLTIITRRLLIEDRVRHLCYLGRVLTAPFSITAGPGSLLWTRVTLGYRVAKGKQNRIYPMFPAHIISTVIRQNMLWFYKWTLSLEELGNAAWQKVLQLLTRPVPWHTLHLDRPWPWHLWQSWNQKIIDAQSFPGILNISHYAQAPFLHLYSVIKFWPEWERIQHHKIVLYDH